ncbi:hypothetical protein GCM10027405_35890 [Arthrobacter alkaliphilus]
MRDDLPGTQFIDPLPALGSVSMQVHRNVHCPGLDRQRIIESGRRKVIDAAHKFDRVAKPRGGRIKDPMAREGSPEAAKCRHRYEQIAEFERPEG